MDAIVNNEQIRNNEEEAQNADGSPGRHTVLYILAVA